MEAKGRLLYCRHRPAAKAKRRAGPPVPKEAAHVPDVAAHGPEEEAATRAGRPLGPHTSPGAGGGAAREHAHSRSGAAKGSRRGRCCCSCGPPTSPTFLAPGVSLRTIRICCESGSIRNRGALGDGNEQQSINTVPHRSALV